MYTTPQMPQEILPEAAKPFPSLWSLTLSTLRLWKDAWGIFSLINLAIVLIGTWAWFSILSIMPWLKDVLVSHQSIDPAIIASHYPSISTLISDLISVCLVLIIFIFCIVMSQVMMICAMNAEMRHKGFKHLFVHSLRLIPGYTWTMAIVSMAALGGIALLVIPGILVMPIAIIAIFVAALEGKSGLRAISQSLFYAKGHIIEALWRSVIIILAIHGISLLLPLLATLPVYPFTLLEFSDKTIRILSFTAGTLYTFVSLILSIIMPSLLMIFYYHLYAHMKDNPVATKPLSIRLFVALACVGLAVLGGVMVLETVGF